MTRSPRVSVIVPSFNQSNYLREALASVRAQTLDDWECIVVDDGSTDGSDRVAQAEITGDPRFTLILQPNRGPSAARNVGLARARGEWVQLLDADDLLDADKLERQLARTHEAPVLQCDYRDRFEGAAHDPARAWHASPQLSPGGELHDLAARWADGVAAPIHSFLVRRELITRHGITFHEGLRTFEDWDFWMRLFATRPAVTFLPAPLVTYQRHPAEITRRLGPMALGFHRALRVQQTLWRDDPTLQRVLRGRQRALPLWTVRAGLGLLAPSLIARARRWRGG